MSISAADFREALRLLPAAVTVVTVRAGAARHGLTVSAVTSISPEPPLVAVVIDQRHRGHRLLAEPDAVFAVNFLREEQRELAERFAWTKEEERFTAGRWETATSGAPVLADALAWLDCRLVARHAAGTHTIHVGEVVASATPDPGGRPLVYWSRGYRRLAG